MLGYIAEAADLGVLVKQAEKGVKCDKYQEELVNRYTKAMNPFLIRRRPIRLIESEADKKHRMQIWKMMKNS
jgi:hypothetical protein